MSVKQLMFALCLALVLVQGAAACAHARAPYEVVLEDEFGSPLPTYPGNGERFALGRDGQRYNVRIQNHTGQRVEAVVSVDGRDVLSGMPGDFRGQRGYIVPAHGSVLIEGFRKSLENVAAFRFTTPEGSYSARMGTPENVGVIGAAFFPEARRTRPPIIHRQIPRRAPLPYGGEGESSKAEDRAAPPRSAQPAPSLPASSSRAERSRQKAGASYEAYAEAQDDTSNIGTEYGEETESQVREVSFVRARKTPERVITLRYDDRDGLIARGILPRPEPRHARGPSAFPVNRFAPPPPPRSYVY